MSVSAIERVLGDAATGTVDDVRGQPCLSSACVAAYAAAGNRSRGPLALRARAASPAP